MFKNVTKHLYEIEKKEKVLSPEKIKRNENSASPVKCPHC